MYVFMFLLMYVLNGGMTNYPIGPHRTQSDHIGPNRTPSDPYLHHFTGSHYI